MKHDQKTSSMIRTFLVYLAVLTVGVMILVKAILVQTKDGDELRALAEVKETCFDTLHASRGNILASDGSILATDAPIFEVCINPSVIPDSIFYEGLTELSQKLAKMSLTPKKSADTWMQCLTNAKKSGKSDYRLILKATLEQFQEVEACRIFNQNNKKAGLIQKNPSFKRIHPYDPLAGRTIGYITATNIVGLESAYDSILRGKDGIQKQRILHKGNNDYVSVPVEDENNIEAVNGNDIVTTIDIDIQDIVERSLRNALVKNKAEQGCAIVMEVKTGAVKAISNLQYDKTTDKYTEERNFAIGDGIEPGSVFKLPSMLVLLETYPELNINTRNINIGKAGTPLIFPGNNKMFDDHAVNQDGWVTIREIFEQSSNKGTAKLITDYFGNNPERYVNSLYNLGLNKILGTGIAGEAKPRIKHPIFDKKHWSKTTLPWMSIGYEIKVSPLQILTLYNAVANEGRMMKPMFVKEIRQNGVTLQTIEPVVTNERIASQKTIDSIQSMMVGVVERGTAKLLKGTKYGIAGKTGTAQLYNVEKKAYKWLNAHGKWERDYNVTFVGFFPIEQPIYSCIVVISKPKGDFYSAGKVAAPAFKEIADRIYATKIKDLIEIETEPTTFRDAEYHYDTNPTQYDPMLVPDVQGMSLSDAVYLLENMGWSTSFKGYGQVVQQSVPAGDSLRPGSLIALTLEKK